MFFKGIQPFPKRNFLQPRFSWCCSSLKVQVFGRTLIIRLEISSVAVWRYHLIELNNTQNGILSLYLRWISAFPPYDYGRFSVDRNRLYSNQHFQVNVGLLSQNWNSMVYSLTISTISLFTLVNSWCTFKTHQFVE